MANEINTESRAPIDTPITEEQLTETDKAALKNFPNTEAYNKLTDEEKAEFNNPETTLARKIELLHEGSNRLSREKDPPNDAPPVSNSQ